MTDAAVLLLDEPTKSLDRAGRDDARQLVLEPSAHAGPRAVLWITHDEEESRTVGARSGVLRDGCIE
jgi:ABC-type sulfate/molybdate transport systems ATPase subunit